MTLTPTPPAKVEAIRQAWQAGERRDNIAIRLGVSVRTVTKYTRDVPRDVKRVGRRRKVDG
jgi:DNA-binding transcriptional regulator YiaG